MNIEIAKRYFYYSNNWFTYRWLLWIILIPIFIIALYIIVSRRRRTVITPNNQYYDQQQNTYVPPPGTQNYGYVPQWTPCNTFLHNIHRRMVTSWDSTTVTILQMTTALTLMELSILTKTWETVAARGISPSVTISTVTTNWKLLLLKVMLHQHRHLHRNIPVHWNLQGDTQRVDEMQTRC